MKNLIKAILIVVSTFLFFYLMMAFILMEFNPAYWSEIERALIDIVSPCCSIIFLGIAKIIKQ